MDTSISDNLISKKKKVKRKSPLSDTYKKYLKKEDISLSPTKKKKPTKLEDIKINVIKSPEIHKEKPEKTENIVKKKVKKDIIKDNTNQKKKHKEKPKKKSSKRKKSSRKKKSKKISHKQSLKKEIEKTKGLSDDSMKKELLKDGIEIKGNHKKLLRDIYAFSKLGGIKVHKE